VEVKYLRPHQPDEFVLINNKNELKEPAGILHFSVNCLDDGQQVFENVYCFPCFLIGGGTVWTNSSYRTSKY
jgi:hypothetical protein